MLRITSDEKRLCEGISRREILRIGAAGLFGLNAADLLKAAETKTRRKAKSLILFFLEGGPAHQDLWDMKPKAPEAYRGEFKPIHTSAAEIKFCEHLPLLSKQAHHLMLVRSVHHEVADHNAGAYLAMTGQSPVVGGGLITRPSQDNFPPFGAVLAKLRPSGRPLPDFVQTPDWMSNNGSFLPGQDAGFLGASFHPFITGDPSLPRYKVPGLDLPRNVSLDRIDRRRSLLETLDHALEPGPEFDRLNVHYRKAFSLVASPEAPRVRPFARTRIGSRTIRSRPQKSAQSRGPQIRRVAAIGPMSLAGETLDRSRRAGRDRLHRRALRPNLGHAPRSLPLAQAVDPADVRPRFLYLAGRHE